ncbi:MAG TPA: prepilin-type N-terminal cleavage/methylation domain-containing protein [Bdellovibrionota bacterium]|nr:prepilin-type N-terminal cleavage/methylation domain-containing protein [Bdellovibrionota bacterium]
MHKFFRKKGFTIIELMVVVFIIAVLAAVAIPLVGRYLKKSKTAEAALNIRKIYDGEVSYFQEEHTLSSGVIATRIFITAPRTPANPGIQKQLGNFESVAWSSLKFGADGPVLFSYSADANGSGTTASFTARAEGDMDGDQTTSLFERVGSVNASTGEVEGGAALYSLDDIE